MKFVELHLKDSNRKVAVNPLAITIIVDREDGHTRICYTDLNQRDISQLLKEEYGYNVDRQTIRRAIEDMQIYDLPVKCSLKQRAGNDFYMTDIYYDGGK